MENIVKNGVARQVIGRYKAILDAESGEVRAVPLKAVYRVIGGTLRLIWELVNSCFGSGVWVNDRPWNNSDGWNNGT